MEIYAKKNNLLFMLSKPTDTYPRRFPGYFNIYLNVFTNFYSTNCKHTLFSKLDG